MGNHVQFNPAYCLFASEPLSIAVSGTGVLNLGTNNIDADPLFNDADGDDDDASTVIDNDYRIGAGSPCTDAGDNTASGLASMALDLGLRPRFVDDPTTVDTGIGPAPVVDMGAYELQASSCIGDINGDGAVDAADLSVLLSEFATAGPQGDVNGDGAVDSADLAVLIGVFGSACP